jgi:hypothetical protein
MNNLPLARHRDVVVQEFDKEILVYDLNTHKIHSLNQTSAIVYRHCDGRTTFEELKRKNKFSDDLIHLAIDQLREVNLIETDNRFASPFSGMSRREAIRRVGLASMIALPFITSLVAPTAAMAQSSGAPGATANCQPCTTDSQCASGNCVSPNASGGPDVCSAGSSTSQALPSGATIGFVSPVVCSIQGSQMCCNGSAAVDSSGFCVCN